MADEYVYKISSQYLQNKTCQKQALFTSFRDFKLTHLNKMEIQHRIS